MRIPVLAWPGIPIPRSDGADAPLPSVCHVPSRDAQAVLAEYRVDKRTHRVFTRLIGGSAPDWRLEPHLAVGLLPWMKTGTRLIVADGDLSPMLEGALPAIQDFYRLSYPSFSRVTVAPGVRRKPAPPRGKRVASLLSGGVDSLFTLLSNLDEITDLVFVHGWDVALENERLRNEVARTNREIAAHFGMNFIEIETNVRDLLDSYLNWGSIGHGAAIAGMAHLLPSSIGRIRIPSSSTSPSFMACASHPDLDHLWSTESLEFVHDGFETSRPEKMALISQFQFALDRLHVCWENPGGAYNCGRCEKCVRNMISLIACGALERCHTLPNEIDVDFVPTMLHGDRALRDFSIENLQALERIRGHQALKEALRRAIAEPRWRVRLRHGRARLGRLLKADRHE